MPSSPCSEWQFLYIETAEELVTSQTSSLMHALNAASSPAGLECWLDIWLTPKWCKIVLCVIAARRLSNFKGFFITCYKNTGILSREPPCRRTSDVAGKSQKHKGSKEIKYQTYQNYCRNFSPFGRCLICVHLSERHLHFFISRKKTNNTSQPNTHC